MIFNAPKVYANTAANTYVIQGDFEERNPQGERVETLKNHFRQLKQKPKEKVKERQKVEDPHKKDVDEALRRLQKLAQTELDLGLGDQGDDDLYDPRNRRKKKNTDSFVFEKPVEEEEEDELSEEEEEEEDIQLAGRRRTAEDELNSQESDEEGGQSDEEQDADS